VVARAGPYAEVHPKSDDRDHPSPLKVKQVWAENARRYVGCVNEDQATKDRYDREEADRHGAPLTIIVNRKLAQHFWPGQDPLGRRMRLATPESDTPWLTVVVGRCVAVIQG